MRKKELLKLELIELENEVASRVEEIELYEEFLGSREKGYKDFELLSTMYKTLGEKKSRLLYLRRIFEGV